MDDIPGQLSWQMLNAKRYSAKRLLLELGIGSPPVDVFAIPATLGARLHFVRGAAWDGAVESTPDGNANIYVNADQVIARQRFTVAHELGHLLLHRPGRAFRDKWSAQGTSAHEMQANTFAANLLMPSWMVHAFAPGKEVTRLAQIFNVSQEAMRYRLQNLGYRIL